MPGFVSNQSYIYASLGDALDHGAKFSIIKGNPGSGKTFLIESLRSKLPNIRFYKLSGDCYSQRRAYYPFRNLLNEVYTNDQKMLSRKLRREAIQNTLSQAGSISPLGADTLSACITELSGASKKRRELQNIAFQRDEIELLFPLDYFCGGSEPAVFLADDLQYWDEDSLQLLYTLVRRHNEPESFLKKAMFVATINTTIQPPSMAFPGLEEEAGQHVYLLERIGHSEYGTVMDMMGCNVHLSEELISTLYSITGGNLQLTADIVLLLHNSSDIEDTIRQIILKKNLGRLVIERLNKSGNDGFLVNDALKFGSLFGNSFYYHDLEPALELQESKIRALIGTAQDYSLVKGMPTGASFIHELIRETYQKEANDDKVRYYIGFSNCLKLLYPGNYLARAESLFTAGQYEDSRNIFLLHMIKELRNRKSPGSTLLPSDLPVRLQEYADAMKAAYHAFDEGEYRRCLELLEEIEDIYPRPLAAEKYYLMSVTLSKWLDNRSRMRAKTCLEPYLDLEYLDKETEIWERILSAYIVACVHNNDIELAQKYEKDLNHSITQRIDFDLEASYRLNTLRRKASGLHPPPVSFKMVQKSKDFFAPRRTAESGGAPLDPVEYYMSLNNYIATALMAGKATEVFQDADFLIKLPLTYRYLKFPRYEMPLNNAVLVAFLNDAVSAKDAELSLQNILARHKAENTTAVIIRVNIAVFASLQGNLDQAKDSLEALAQETSKIDNLEFYYLYLIQVNLAAVLYALGQKESAIQILEDLSRDPVFSFDEFLEGHARALLTDCSTGQLDDNVHWYQQAMLIPDSLRGTTWGESWKYYGNKYLFGELEFWSES
ncbi:MAG: AAA family ATPase [Oscillibacter sp.]|nr:AAA family ATPase [Oscillibacter sp.]